MLAATIELLDADKGVVQLLDPERCVLTIACQRGFKQEFLDFFREVSRGAARLVADPCARESELSLKTSKRTPNMPNITRSLEPRIIAPCSRRL
jgi:hypothetical protein